ncbi:hypothetical protein [Qipengyuania atrilutea]|uniref:Uncharacterized protein n=1 Tax=Qipengyuania atrilutea TaxID=2744473 RepID=A0A850H4T6_9SPHN|nr:hypothetical protein [Actirhodobacter atriluteus]NVD45517.1 hypothetical protein [Actirhodobacter atriluteus]
MSSMSFRSSRPDSWVEPRAYRDASLRLQKYGRVQPMHQPSLLERLFASR